MVKRIFLILFVFLPTVMPAQEVLTPEQRLEKARKEEKAALEEIRAREDARKKSNLSANGSEKTARSGDIHHAMKSRKNNYAPQKTVSGGKELEDDPGYLEGAVPVNSEGKVVFTTEMWLPNTPESKISDVTYKFLDELTKAENQIQSRIAYVNNEEKTIAAVCKEWMVFRNSFLSLDRTQFEYTIVARWTDDKLTVSMERIHYNYDEGRPSHLETTADKFITDDIALNKKKTRIMGGFAKFRKKTIDRKDEIFNALYDKF